MNDLLWFGLLLITNVLTASTIFLSWTHNNQQKILKEAEDHKFKADVESSMARILSGYEPYDSANAFAVIKAMAKLMARKSVIERELRQAEGD